MIKPRELQRNQKGGKSLVRATSGHRISQTSVQPAIARLALAGYTNETLFGDKNSVIGAVIIFLKVIESNQTPKSNKFDPFQKNSE